MTWLPSTPAVSAHELANASRLVVHCWAEWNAIDQVFDQSVPSLCQEFGAHTIFRSCNVDDPQFLPILREWGILNVPAIVMLERGRKVDVSYGLSSTRSLDSVLRMWLVERPIH